MTREQFNVLVELFEAIVDEKVSDAFGRDSLHEMVRRNKTEDEARELLVTGRD